MHTASPRKPLNPDATPRERCLLADAQVETIARRVVGLLQGFRAPRQLLDAEGLTTHLNVDRSWVYANAQCLGALRLGAGPKARLRFSLERVEEALSASSRQGPEAWLSDPVEPTPRRPRRRAASSGVELLPIRPRAGSSRRSGP